MRRIRSAADRPTRRLRAKHGCLHQADCILVSSRSPLKYVFRTSSMAWQNPQMKNREATMRNANRKGLRLDFMSISIAVVYYGFGLMENALAAFAQSVLLI